MTNLRSMGLRIGVRVLGGAALVLSAATPALADCGRTYSIGFSDSGTFAFIQNQEVKGLIPVVLAELTRRTGCNFELKQMPRARLWAQWKAGALDAVSGAVQSTERDRDGVWGGFTYAQEMLVSDIAPPAGTLESWLNLPQRPMLGRLRSAISGSSVDALLADPRYAQQVDDGVDHVALLRKLLAKRDSGVLLARPAFDAVARELGVDSASIPSHAVKELPRVAYGFYFRTPQVAAVDLQRILPALEAMERSGFDETAYGAIVGKVVAAQLYQGK